MSNLFLSHEVNHDQYKADGLAFALVNRTEAFVSFLCWIMSHDMPKKKRK